MDEDFSVCVNCIEYAEVISMSCLGYISAPVSCTAYTLYLIVINPRRACAARVTVVVLCVCACFRGPSSATDATKRQSRHTGGLSIMFASV